MILTTNIMCEEPWQSNEFININRQQTALAVTASMQGSNTIV